MKRELGGEIDTLKKIPMAVVGAKLTSIKSVGKKKVCESARARLRSPMLLKKLSMRPSVPAGKLVYVMPFTVVPGKIVLSTGRPSYVSVVIGVAPRAAKKAAE